MKDYGGSISFHLKTWHQTYLVFMLLAFKMTIAKASFLHYDIKVKPFLTTLYLPLHCNVSTWLHIILQPHLQYKGIFINLATIFISRTKKTDLRCYYVGHFSKFCLRQQLFANKVYYFLCLNYCNF